MVNCTTVEAPQFREMLVDNSEMKLPYDIIFAVMKVQAVEGNTNDLSAMMKTCGVLRLEGAKYLLNRCGVTLRDDQDVRSFSKFMFADAESRFSAFKYSFTICGAPLSLEGASALASIVPRTSRLERLVLRNADLLFASAPIISAAFRSLRCLKHLDYTTTGDRDQHQCCNDFLEDLQSPLHSATLHLPPQGEDAAPCSQHRFLLHSQHTLTELHATNIDSLLIYSPGTHVFPAVRRLVLHCSEAPLMFLFSQTFPNITSLDFTCSCPYEHEYLRNFAELEAGPDGVVPWSALESITGTMEDLYYVGLCQRVANVHVRRIIVEDLEKLFYLEDVLKFTTPSRLRLDVDLEVFSSGKYHALQEMLEVLEGAGQLDAMHVVIDVRGVDPETDLEELCEWVLRMVKPLRLASLECQALASILPLFGDGANIKGSSDKLDSDPCSQEMRCVGVDVARTRLWETDRINAGPLQSDVYIPPRFVSVAA
ncbi:hypothetical protein C8Q74DRAFT_354234 [Fomes fomentarius]|nr:hypothetical protein C8Q74DRAFT_354234 [Fomes fomentarius]